MVVNVKESPTKDLLQRSNIRTMKKDLARLREADSLREKQKISNIQPIAKPVAQIVQTEALPKVAGQLTEPKIIKKEPEVIIKEASEAKPRSESADSTNGEKPPAPVLRENQIKENQKPVPPIAPVVPVKVPASPMQSAGQPNDTQARAKALATEAEKQQIFLLQSQLSNLKNQINSPDAGNDPSLMLEKNKILVQKESWQKKLQSVMQEIKKLEEEYIAIENKETASTLPAEKEALQKEKLAKEEEQQNKEKQQWSIETELAKLENTIKSLDESGKQSQMAKDTIKTKMTGVDNSLKALYDSILARSQDPKPPVKKPEVSVPVPRENQALKTPVKPQPVPKQHIKEAPLAANPAFAESSKAAMEKLAQSTQIEEKQRLKFMEDVERWIAAEKNNQRSE